MSKMGEPVQGSDGMFYNLRMNPDVDENTLSFLSRPHDPKPKSFLNDKAFSEVSSSGSHRTFAEFGLPEPLLRALALLNFRWPSRIQVKSIPLLLANPPQNLLGQSQSGTGKTAAFVIAILTRINFSLDATQAVIIAPTRELARQIMEVVRGLGQYMGVKTQYAIPFMYERGKKFTAHVVVGTPGTILDCIRKGVLVVDHLKILVIDEADNMLDQQGLGEQCVRVKSTIRHRVQILLWSATFPQTIVDYSKRFAPDCLTLTLEHHELTVVGIKQMYMDCQNADHKFHVLVQLYHVLTIGSSIIFVHQRKDATEIAARMSREGHKVSVLHSALENGGAARDKVIDDFRDGRTKVLITTNVLARGIDVATTSMVVNYDLPMDKNRHVDFETYLHRIGRTGRFGRIGVSISFVHDRTSWAQLRDVSRHFGVQISKVPTENIDEVESIVNAVLKHNEDMLPAVTKEDSRHAPQK